MSDIQSSNINAELLGGGHSRRINIGDRSVDDQRFWNFIKRLCLLHEWWLLLYWKIFLEFLAFVWYHQRWIHSPRTTPTILRNKIALLPVPWPTSLLVFQAQSINFIQSFFRIIRLSWHLFLTLSLVRQRNRILILMFLCFFRTKTDFGCRWSIRPGHTSLRYSWWLPLSSQW